MASGQVAVWQAEAAYSATCASLQRARYLGVRLSRNSGHWLAPESFFSSFSLLLPSSWPLFFFGPEICMSTTGRPKKAVKMIISFLFI